MNRSTGTSHDRRPFPLAVAGTGRPLGPMLTFLRRRDFTDAFPWVKLVAVVLPHGMDLPPMPLAEGLPRYGDAATLFASHPDLRLILDLTDDGSLTDGLRASAPPGVSVVGPDSALVLLEVMASERMCGSCNVQLQQARDLFATLIDQVDEDILLIDTEGHILDLNRNILERKGGTKDDWVGACCKEIDGPDFCAPPERGGCPFRETTATGRKAERIHTKVDEEGRVRYFRVYTYPVQDQNGRLTSIIEMRRDITNRTNMELRLQQSEKLAAIGELATYIAHEIRNPLFAIGGFANSLLRLPTLDETARGKVQVILEESRRLDNILRSILNFARPTTSKAGKADLNGVVRQTLELMAFGFDTRRITSELALAADLPRVRGDAELIKQCLINLVKNAQEAMPGGGVLTVRTGMTHSHVFVTVEDSGEGIPAEMHERIFSPFFSTKEKGAGIGLAMTRKIVEDMGGKVDLVSHVGKGTRITLFLPPVLAVPEGETPPHANGPAGEDTPGETGGQGSPSSRDAQTSETATSGTPPPPETASAPASSATSPCPFARKA